ncbi:hypothetical protein [Sphingomonas crocodyli]|uniref:Uncharacterized protein n=1 Tax=Sphingomonas crocodyli TaxID=1979270 RepID=A0A437M5B7_9SPHN|nr:hypothetical protein [Sphingomonas crocodyli]RVT92842.1 hypothetical protein EOD43_02700 [Sphingomonas crocodyli]
MGGLFGGSQKTKSTSTTDTGPSKFQEPYLQSAFDGAQSLYDSKTGTPFYQGDLYAGMSDAAKSDLSSMKAFASGTGLDTAGRLSALGADLSGHASKAGTSIDDFLKLANGDATAENIAAASKYADNPYLSGQIDAVNRDVSRQLNEQTLPTINRVASATGNINSSRAGVASGIAERGAADRMADNAATVRGQAYDRGLSLASSDRSTKLSALGTAANAYTGLAGMGISALGAGAQAGYGAYDVLNRANLAEQADRQGQADADYKKWQGEDTREADLLDRYYQIIGGNPWGQSGTTTGTQTTSGGAGLLSTLAGGAALAGGLGWKPFAKGVAK